MYKIIIYGVFSLELRRRIESFLDEEYTILGYTDSNISKDILDGKKFFKPNELRHVTFDYIVVAVNNIKVCRQIKEELVFGGGISSDKIICPTIFLSDSYKLQKDMINHIDLHLNSEIETVIFGLSYSLRGIDKDLLKQKAFDFSWHGLDLYYNFRLLKYSIEKGYITRVSNAVLVFPYNYFNHDMSVEPHQYKTGQILSVSRLNDFHNCDLQYNEEIFDCVMSIKLFGKKFLKYYRASENIYAYHKNINLTDKIELGHTWEKKHPKTLSENVDIFDELISELRCIAKRIILVIPPFYWKAIKISNNVIDECRKDFYEIIQLYDIEVIDLLDYWNENEECFYDATHLNYEGAKKFTNLLNDILDNKF